MRWGGPTAERARRAAKRWNDSFLLRSYFAWLPTKTKSGRWVWLEIIYVARVEGSYGFYWEYTE
jgi:hypothetical protein